MRIELENQPGADCVATEPVTSSRPSHKAAKPNTRLLSVTPDDGVFRVRLESGNLRSLDTSKLRAEIAALHTPGNPPAVVFSMRSMDSLSSGSLGSLAQLSTDLEHVGGAMVLYNLPKDVSKVLKKTKLDRVLMSAKTRAQAKKRALTMKRKLAQQQRSKAA